MAVEDSQVVTDFQNCVSKWRGVSADEAEEIVAESLKSMVIKQSKGVVIERPVHWLLKAAEYVRRQLSEKKVKALPLLEPAFPDRLDDESADVLRLRECVAALPEPYRQAVELCDYGNLSHEEAAQVAHIPRRTMQSRHRKAFELLRNVLLH